MSKDTRIKSEKLRDSTIFVGGLDKTITETILFNYFKQFGKPLDYVYIPTNSYSNKYRYYGFVRFTNLEDAQGLIDGHHILTQLNGKQIFISRARTKTKIFIANLDSNVTEETLNESFSKFGQMVEGSLVYRDMRTGKSKNCAVITYESYESADRAIAEMNNTYLENRRIIVKFSEKRGSKPDRLTATRTFTRTSYPRDAVFMRPEYQQPHWLDSRATYYYGVASRGRSRVDWGSSFPQQNQSDQDWDRTLLHQEKSIESPDDSIESPDDSLLHQDGLYQNYDQGWSMEKQGGLNQDQDWSMQQQNGLNQNKDQDWSIQQQDGLNQDQNWSVQQQDGLNQKQDQDWSVQQQDGLNQDPNWSVQQQDCLNQNKDQDLSIQQQDGLNQDPNWSVQQQDGLNQKQDQDWSVQQQDGLNQDPNWSVQQQDCLNQDPNWSVQHQIHSMNHWGHSEQYLNQSMQHHIHSKPYQNRFMHHHQIHSMHHQDRFMQHQNHSMCHQDHSMCHQDHSMCHQDQFRQHQNHSIYHLGHSQQYLDQSLQHPNQLMQHPSCNVIAPLPQQSCSNSLTSLCDSTTRQYQAS